MSNLSKFYQYYLKAKSNRWYWLFSVFCRVSLAYAFIVAGGVKIAGERFASGLSVLHPMGAYLEALHHTGYYYTFIGYAQIIAAVLLLIPRTVVLGAMIYFPIILNICILSIAVRFEGSFVTSPLMVLANLFLLVWHYDKVRFILPFKNHPEVPIVKKPKKYSNRFPFVFVLGVLATVLLTLTVFLYGFKAMPRNSILDCQSQFVNTEYETKGFTFCECIHMEGRSLDECLEEFENER
ncbi:hypothetical protein MATR_24010 [Marivirga tractuosa]|uniref:DoxX family protein n=1 Tax=Marivirga tractuosa (strain ATCC 23168 / DSM 4126 / NBRC 15989 / NCIMB 1408 / VKM B-1430 / H-43) TaxID=643867 RepID=E4TR91_MARTH|nr:hypothetical protein [Marivirga tractuosa]ADR23743.1 hypothetical protein Ftrac_3776 [Marivirga tractuosa DSM 4126]BDD15576.1 hypothetical protein MATR_24010 [Marivirga tractuosa]